MNEVGSPSRGKTSTLNSALPPIGQRWRDIGDVEVPHRRPAAQDQAIEGARVHLLAHRRPAPVALLERGRGIFHELAHGGSLSSESCAGLTRASIFFAKKFL